MDQQILRAYSLPFHNMHQHRHKCIHEPNVTTVTGRCWCSVLGDLYSYPGRLLVEHQFGYYKLSITLKIKLGWSSAAQMAMGSHSSAVRAPAAKAGGSGFNSPAATLGVSSSSWLTNVDGMKGESVVL